MKDGDKLHRVTITTVAYVMAADWREARSFQHEILRTESVFDVDADRVSPTDQPESHWRTGSLVYHDGSGDVLLTDVWPKDDGWIEWGGGECPVESAP